MGTRMVTVQGNELHLKGDPVGEGEEFPEFRVAEGVPDEVAFDDDEKERTVHLVTTAVSIDTPVCADQFRAFDARAGELEESGVEVWYVTRDLPFAMERFADEHGLENLRFLSDYKRREFGEKTGLAVEETELLARATFVVDRDGRIVYEEVLDEIAEEPDYDAAVEAALEAAGGEGAGR